MLLVINISNLVFLILGWDGLGLVSFFLIVYYQNQSSITSGIFTLLINRIGDAFFLGRIICFYYYYSDLTFFSSNLVLSKVSLRILLLTFITKRAIYPFSPWLPLAMAAPTPISALVHSRTLVTSGLFLIMRFSYLLYSFPFLIKLLIILSIFTSFYAGLNSMYECDIKKLIALSTLSHLGFIGLRFSAGLLTLAFFHLLTHALFKSLLFITIGDIIINLSHSQDIRFLSSGVAYTPFSCIVMYVSLLNLLGIPNIRGFFSKDLVLELLNYSNASIILSFILYVNVFFTYFYTYQLYFYSFQSNKITPFFIFHFPLKIHACLLLVLGVVRVVFGKFFIILIFKFILFMPCTFALKIFPITLNLCIFLYLVVFLCFPKSVNVFVNSYLSSILYLRNIMLSFRSSVYLKSNYTLVKSFEQGFLNYRVNHIPFFLSN